jgi:hypothetical protein
MWGESEEAEEGVGEKEGGEMAQTVYAYMNK